MSGWAAAAGAAMDLANTGLSYYQSLRNERLQREFAKNGIRWRVEDAKAAGIHPLYALGANTTSFSPVAVDGSGLSGAGQHIARAIEAKSTQKEREAHTALQLETLKLQNEGMRLDNEIRQAELNSKLAVQNHALPPPLPSALDNHVIDGQGNSFPSMEELLRPTASTPIASQPGIPAQEVGAVSDYGFVRTPDGFAIVPSKDAKERIEDQFIPELSWAIRNNFLPMFRDSAPPKEWLKKFGKDPADGWRWTFNPLTGSYVPVKEVDSATKKKIGAKYLRKMYFGF